MRKPRAILLSRKSAQPTGILAAALIGLAASLAHCGEAARHDSGGGWGESSGTWEEGQEGDASPNTGATADADVSGGHPGRSLPGGGAACGADQICNRENCVGPHGGSTDPDCPASGSCYCDWHDSICEPSAECSTDACGCDPDCDSPSLLPGPCGRDGHCDTWCPTGADPDCEGKINEDCTPTSTDCYCDHFGDVCETAADCFESPCECDPDCMVGGALMAPCAPDSHCDTWCPTEADPDCLGEPNVDCGEDTPCGARLASAACSECIGASCCAELEACKANVDCFQGLDCLEDCSDYGCFMDCVSAVPELMDVVLCGQLCQDECIACTADCTGKECGSDGCGGTCGPCDGGTCSKGICTYDYCGKKTVACTDGGVCAPGSDCIDGDCYCPVGKVWVNCEGDLCGDDWATNCPGTNYRCVADTASYCGAGASDCMDGWICPGNSICGGGGSCSCPSGKTPVDCAGNPCSPNCPSKAWKCACVPNCAGKQCGGDGCGGSCGSCGAGQACSPAGTCACVPNCTGKTCGPDGCGGVCGPNGGGCASELYECSGGVCKQVKCWTFASGPCYKDSDCCDAACCINGTSAPNKCQCAHYD